MYVPPLNAVLKTLGIDHGALEDAKSVNVPVPLLKLLLQVVVANGDFNEEGYLAANPDLAAAVKRKELEDPRVHYVGFGYFEGRQGATPPVDEQWYRRKFPDVDKAIKSGALRSAAEHFEIQGASEGRAPSGNYESDAAQWKRAFGIY